MVDSLRVTLIVTLRGALPETALWLSGEPHQRRGIYMNLAESFDFDALRGIQSREAFLEALPQISATSKKYLLLSTQYFDASGRGNVELLGGFQLFNHPKHLTGTDLSVQAKEVSFTTWIRVLDDFRGSLCFCVVAVVFFEDKDYASACKSAPLVPLLEMPKTGSTFLPAPPDDAFICTRCPDPPLISRLSLVLHTLSNPQEAISSAKS